LLIGEKHSEDGTIKAPSGNFRAASNKNPVQPEAAQIVFVMHALSVKQDKERACLERELESNDVEAPTRLGQN
jgi:hypothetical protein